ncbi:MULTISPECIES: hypothetical protein [unclassified Bacillus (in: firmicutes)]|uniref:hypothetical protein n=1 Tax=unclassified Bacillus (in: firmicutes) TaxID=185979 RepID=UPI0008E3760F|nr:MULTISPECIES: hypothetical protein [unclassified Bacillus (in: firmicutes)]PGZ89270.1 hypothetical protein COE53_18880 [Bacillus sp. AFS029533]SFD50112.1 hypothetical protein SAMN02799633_03985 [Bacillus sp. UNCCL81]
MEHPHIRNMQDKCKKYKLCHVVFQTSERALLEGILLDNNSSSAELLVPEDLAAPESRFFEVRQNSGETFLPRYRIYKKVTVPLSSVVSIYLFPYYYPSYPYIYQRNYHPQ